MPEATKRPLKWLVGLNEAEPHTVETRVAALLGEGPTVLEEIAHQGGDLLRLMLEKDAAPVIDLSILTLGARLLNSARAISLLLQHGYIASSVLLEREMIHILVLAMFLHDHPVKAETWSKAGTSKDRLQFAFGNIWRKVEHGEAWKKVYDYFSTMGHANEEARVTYGKLRQVFGYDMQLRGFYDPIPITLLFVQTLKVLLWFRRYFQDWYREELNILTEFEPNLERLDAATEEFERELRRRAERDDTSGAQKDSLSIPEQVAAWVRLSTMMEQKRARREMRP